MLRAALTLLSAPIFAYGVLYLWVYVTQRGQIYFPTPASERPGAQAMWLESQDERIGVGGLAARGSRASVFRRQC